MRLIFVLILSAAFYFFSSPNSLQTNPAAFDLVMKKSTFSPQEIDKIKVYEYYNESTLDNALLIAEQLLEMAKNSDDQYVHATAFCLLAYSKESFI